MRKRKPRAERPAAFFCVYLGVVTGWGVGTRRRCGSDALDGAHAVRSCVFVAFIAVFRLLRLSFYVATAFPHCSFEATVAFPAMGGGFYQFGEVCFQ